MMKPEFKHKQKNEIKSPTTQPPQKLAAAPAPIPNAYQRKKNPAAQPQVLKPGRNRLLAPSCKELVPAQATEGKSDQGVNPASSSICKDLVVYQNKLTAGLILPDAQISVDKLLSQWADKIEKAEQEFVLEELAFERARDRLKARNGRKMLQTMPQARTAAALVESAGRMARHSHSGLSLFGKTRHKMTW